MLRLAAMLLMLLAVPALAGGEPLNQYGEAAWALAAKNNYPVETTYRGADGVTYTVWCPRDDAGKPPPLSCIVLW